MKEFLINFLFTGISLAIIIPVLILAEKTKRDRFLKILDEKQIEVSRTIDDAEDMLQELNKFSEYIVELIDTKKEEVDVIPVNSMHEEIFMLNEQGLSCEEIAKKLNKGKREIELIINIKKRS